MLVAQGCALLSLARVSRCTSRDLLRVTVLVSGRDGLSPYLRGLVPVGGALTRPGCLPGPRVAVLSGGALGGCLEYPLPVRRSPARQTALQTFPSSPAFVSFYSAAKRIVGRSRFPCERVDSFRGESYRRPFVPSFARRGDGGLSVVAGFSLPRRLGTAS